MHYNFDEIVDRSKNHSAKWNEMEFKFGSNDLWPMWIADMDFKTAPEIIEAMQEKLDQGIFGYVNRPKEYYEVAKDWIKRRHSFELNTECLTYSPGVVPALSMIIEKFTEPGDKILIQTPVYYPFFSVVEENNRTLVLNPLKKGEQGDYTMDYEDLESKIDDKVKFLILCSPHNPVGRVWREDELRKLGDICFKNNIKVISDEIHSDIVYKPNKHIPFASLGKEFEENTITCFAPTKGFNIAGLYSAFILFPNKEYLEIFETELGRIDLKRNNPFSLVSTMAAYERGEKWLEELLIYIESNIDYVMKYIKENLPKIKVRKPEATYLLWLDFSEYGISKEKLAELMVKEGKIAFDYGHWFGSEGENFQRMNVACPRYMVEEGLKRIKKAVGKYEG